MGSNGEMKTKGGNLIWKTNIVEGIVIELKTSIRREMEALNQFAHFNHLKLINKNNVITVSGMPLREQRSVNVINSLTMIFQ